LRHLFKRDVASPFVTSGPTRYRSPGVGGGAHRDPAAISISEVARCIGVDEVVDRLRPFPKRLLAVICKSLPAKPIDVTVDGDALIAPNITARLLAAFADTALQRPPEPLEPLTAREEEVLVTVARGWTNHEIADDLHVSISTVKTHLAALMRKLHARNRVEIAMWAYETGRVKT
jgi:DNA-binding CsgD family transcriptional regulator